jgi:hypothetical protein
MGGNWVHLKVGPCGSVRTFRGGSRIEEVSYTMNNGDYVFTLNVHTNDG